MMLLFGITVDCRNNSDANSKKLLATNRQVYFEP